MGNNNKSRKHANDGFSAPVKKNKDNAGKSKTLISVISMVLVLALFAGVIVYSKVVDNGFFYRNSISVSSENFEVNNAMLQYYFNTIYANLTSTLQQMGVDTQKNLKESQFTSTQSWFSYIMDSTLDEVRGKLVLCEAAKAAGVELDEHDREHIDEAMDSIKEMAKSYADAYGGAEVYYLRNAYGYGINYDDVRNCLEIEQLANKYKEQITEGYEFTEQNWAERLAKDEDSFKVVDYVYYTFAAQTPSTTTTTTTTAAAESETVTGTETAVETTAGVAEAAETVSETVADTADATATGTEEKKEELSAEKQAAKDKALQLYQGLQELEGVSPVATREHFDEQVKLYLDTVVYASTEDAEKKTESIETDMKNTVVEAAAKDDTNEFLKYAFGRKDTDSLVYMTEDDTNGKYSVYYITKTPALEEYETKNVRVISLSAADETVGDVDEKCEAVIAELKENGETEEAFAALADKYVHDSNGGLVENVGKADLPADELKDWLFDEARKPGEYTYASNGEADSNEVVYIIYFVENGLKKWQRDVDNTLMNEKYQEDFAELEKAHAVETDKQNASKIPAQAGVLAASN